MRQKRERERERERERKRERGREREVMTNETKEREREVTKVEKKFMTEKLDMTEKVLPKVNPRIYRDLLMQI